MKSPQSDIDLIERYFDNELSAEEARALKERLTSDAELRKLFERERLLVDAVRVDAAERDLTYLKDLEKTLSKEDRGQRSLNRWYYLAAAATVSILILFMWSPWNSTSPQELYAAHFQPHPNVFEPTLRNESATSTRAEAFRAYEQKDYAKAATLFTEILADRTDPGALMLLGNANLMIGESEKAKENFRSLIINHDDLDIAGKWYLSLTHIRLGQPIQARALLIEIEASSSPYAKKAKDLLREL